MDIDLDKQDLENLSEILTIRDEQGRPMLEVGWVVRMYFAEPWTLRVREAVSAAALVQEATRWCGDGWAARIIQNEEDEGWAVEMTRDGESEPALVGPWTMGRDKKNPKPLDTAAFNTLVKTASEVIRRHEQQLHATLHKRVTVSTDAGRVEVRLDIVPDEYEPYAHLSAFDEFGDEIARVRVRPEG